MDYNIHGLLSELPLSKRAINGLKKANIITVKDLIDYPADDFGMLNQIGAKTAIEIKQFQHLLKLKANSINDNYLEKLNEYDIVINHRGNIIKDTSIEDYSLSNRAYNSLKFHKINSASQLLGLNEKRLKSFNNIGSKSAKEILSLIEHLKIAYTKGNSDELSIKTIIDEMHIFEGISSHVWLKIILDIKTNNPSIQDDLLLESFYHSDFVYQCIKEKIAYLIEANNDIISKDSLKSKLPKHLQYKNIVDKILEELCSDNYIVINDNMIMRNYPSIWTYINSLKDERDKMVVSDRLNGKSLQDIGDKVKVTRERVRQLIIKVIKKRPHVREDKYIYIQTKYHLNRSDFKSIFDESDQTYNYLELFCNARYQHYQDKEALLLDSKIDEKTRKKVTALVYKDYLLIDGEYIKKSRRFLIKYFIRMNCTKTTKYNVFVKKYNQWISSLKLDNESDYLVETRTYENILNTCDFVLWTPWKSLRYYNIANKDFKELLDMIDLTRYKNISLSSLKLYRDYPHLMEQYDIHDEYELHNLLKKIWPNQNDGVVFKKMPTIEIGEVDLEKQVLEILMQHTPSTSDELAKCYEEEYGVKANTAKSSVFTYLDKYYFNGIYKVDFVKMDDDLFNKLKQALDKDFYMISWVEEIYLKLSGLNDLSLLNSYTLKQLGFHVYPGYSGYMIKNSYHSATEYFRYLLTTRDIVDLNDLDIALKYIANFQCELYRLRRNYCIVEIAPSKFINYRILEQKGINKDIINKFCNDVYNYVDEGEIFTMESLRKAGFKHDLDQCAFDDWFLSSLLNEDRGHFSVQRISLSRLFMKGQSDNIMMDLLKLILSKKQKISLSDIMKMIYDEYVVKVTKDKILIMIKESSLYYDGLNEMIYRNYQIYLEEK